ncbi:MAG: CvfB family protein, partial [bacterium]
DTIEVFLYLDSEDRRIATTTQPLLTLGSVARLKVREVTKIGAFLDWGLPKDLFLPFAEQTKRVQRGDEVLAALYVDKSGRLAATMKLYRYLRNNSPYRIGDEVFATVYEFVPNFGTFAAVDDMYSARIPKTEAPDGLPVGVTGKYRVTLVHEDGKLDLSARKKAYEMLDEDGEMILEIIEQQYAGKLPFDDKAEPEEIRRVFGLSKAAFKRAVGRLYKEKKVRLEEGQITAL